jgi:hypothetical protein
VAGVSLENTPIYVLEPKVRQLRVATASLFVSTDVTL